MRSNIRYHFLYRCFSNGSIKAERAIHNKESTQRKAVKIRNNKTLPSAKANKPKQALNTATTNVNKTVNKFISLSVLSSMKFSA